MKTVALAGGVGGAKLADGLASVLSPDELIIIVNTGDDFIHLGLFISPDLDTVCYTLAGIANPDTGWGCAGETWNVMEAIEHLGGPSWFRLGDNDLALHLERTRRIQEGELLSNIVSDVCEKFSIEHQVLPMSNDSVPTWVYTDEGELPFQEYFVKRKCLPKVSDFEFRYIDKAAPAPGVITSIQEADLVVICPSNPWVSIDPILAIHGVRPEIEKKMVVAVSPIVEGRTLKGPAAKMYEEMGIQPSALAVANHYGPLLDGFVFDKLDHNLIRMVEEMDVRPYVTNTIMKTKGDRIQLAEEILAFAEGMNYSLETE